MKGDENDKTFDHPTGFEKPTLLIKINAVFTGDPILNNSKEKGILKRSNKFLEK